MQPAQLILHFFKQLAKFHAHYAKAKQVQPLRKIFQMKKVNLRNIQVPTRLQNNYFYLPWKQWLIIAIQLSKAFETNQILDDIK